MKALIDKVKNVILVRSLDGPTTFGGEWGEMVQKGDAALVDYPAGEEPEDFDVVSGVLTLNAAKKAARLASKSKAAQLRQDLKDVDVDLLFPALTNPQRQFLNKLRRAAILAIRGIDSED